MDFSPSYPAYNVNLRNVLCQCFQQTLEEMASSLVSTEQMKQLYLSHASVPANEAVNAYSSLRSFVELCRERPQRARDLLFLISFILVPS